MLTVYDLDKKGYKVLKFENLLSKMKHDNYDSILDYINLRIIDILSKDSSTTFVEIAKQIGISNATVHLRVRRLIAAGIITKYNFC